MWLQHERTSTDGRRDLKWEVRNETKNKQFFLTQLPHHLLCHDPLGALHAQNSCNAPLLSIGTNPTKACFPHCIDGQLQLAECDLRKKGIRKKGAKKEETYRLDRMWRVPIRSHNLHISYIDGKSPLSRILERLPPFQAQWWRHGRPLLTAHKVLH